MFFSKGCEYAIRAVIYILNETAKGGRIGVKSICKNVEAPESFTAKVLQDLSRRKVISSIKGPGGGFFLTEDQANKPVINLVKAVDGDQIFQGCGLGLAQCNEASPCPLHYEFKPIRDQLVKVLSQTKMADLASAYSKGTFFLKVE
ncbi:MAG: Rrf2 family transcriptional regulator [Bacteroidota bacterium]|nr:Rrf2 family transcriptional regulator [Bacteroidota bacterium]MDX5404226.1 Rrf2 family transcriptional regulator [Bacteroidota bacterium]MDX5427391.1 Rrf2 family transcriptional regulator [Bacteroidota bacterium]MDX5448164.1 Rrf2 family transcriptional regulator [Bacteroidota bacterium]MDX5505339.1 Rrf2 family transcriptional regulator [Bacteroidota bacterium]